MPIEDILLPFTDAFTHPVPDRPRAVEPPRPDRRHRRLAMLSVLVFAAVLAAVLI
jgi:hypothetical protein